MPDKAGHTIQDIANIIDAGVSAVTAHKQSSDYLDMLIKDSVAKEEAFYAKLPLLDGKPITNIKEMQQLLHQIDQQYNLQALLPGKEIEQALSQPPYNYDLMAKGSKLTREESDIIRRVMQRLYEEGIKGADKIIIGDTRTAVYRPMIRDFVLQAITKGIAKNTNITITEKATLIDPPFNFDLGTFSTEGFAQLEINPSDILRSSLNTKDFFINKTQTGMGKVTINPIDITIDSNAAGKDMGLIGVSNTVKEYLLSIAPRVLNEEFQDLSRDKSSPMDASPEKFRQDVNEVIRSRLRVPNIDRFSSAMSSDIALGRSISTLRGYTGELRAYIMMSLLFPDQAFTTGLKDKITVFKGGAPEEAPVDILLRFLNDMYKEIGIQVKNTISTSYSWEGTMRADNFYNERLQVPMSAAERDYFGAFTYNQIIDSGKLPNRANWDNYERYKAIYKKFDDFSSFEDTYRSLAFNIMRQQTKAVDSGNFMSDIITNEFYFMNDSFIASSQILKAIKDNAFGGSSSYLTTRFSKSPGSGRVWQWGDDFVINYEANSLISYSVNLAFKRLAQSSFNA